MEIQIEKGIPIPHRLSFWHGVQREGAMTDAERKARDVESNRRYVEAKKARGLCAWGACSEEPEAGHTMCRPHLDQMKQGNKSLHEKRAARGLCRQCGEPAFDGLVMCLIHRKGEGLPAITRRRLAEYREQEAVKERLANLQYVRNRFHLLNDRQRKILTLRFGLDGERQHTLEEIGLMFNVTRERIRQIEKRAMFQIEHNIPMPEKGRKGKYAETLNAMNVGDSVLCTIKEYGAFCQRAKAMKFLVHGRRQPDGNYRLWMVSKNSE